MTSRIKLPPRVQQVIIDSETGSYPTTSRTGDRDRLGVAFSRFDDSQTVVFAPSSNVSYPSLAFKDAGYTVGLSSSISAPAVTRKGVSDSFVIVNQPGEALRPFDDSIHIEQNQAASFDPFHLTSSQITDVGPGFSAPLKSKTQIIIDLSPTTEYAASINNGPLAISGNSAKAGNWNFSSTNNFPMA